MSTIIDMVSPSLQTSVNSIAVERMKKASQAMLKGMAPSAWSLAVDIGEVCENAAASRKSRTVLFTIAAKAAMDCFAKERVANGALEKEAKWGAFGTACSTVKKALHFGVFKTGLAKDKLAELCDKAEDSDNQEGLELSYKLGLLPRPTTVESLIVELANVNVGLVNTQEELLQLKGDLANAKAYISTQFEEIASLKAALALATATAQATAQATATV